jgi:hypothetical protein
MNYSNQLSFLRLNITVGNEAQQEKLSLKPYESATEFPDTTFLKLKELYLKNQLVRIFMKYQGYLKAI